MRISDWSSDVCSSDLDDTIAPHNLARHTAADSDIGLSKAKSCAELGAMIYPAEPPTGIVEARIDAANDAEVRSAIESAELVVDATATLSAGRNLSVGEHAARTASVFFSPSGRSEEHKSELQSLMRITYA